MNGQIIGAIATTLGAGIAGWFALLAKRAQHRAPESVAGGYSRLVEDMRQELTRLSERVVDLEKERAMHQARLQCMDRKIVWLSSRISEDDRIEYDTIFPREKKTH